MLPDRTVPVTIGGGREGGKPGKVFCECWIRTSISQFLRLVLLPIERTLDPARSPPPLPPPIGLSPLPTRGEVTRFVHFPERRSPITFAVRLEADSRYDPTWRGIVPVKACPDGGGIMEPSWKQPPMRRVQ